MAKEKNSKTTSADKGSFFQNLLASLFKSNNPDAEKKRKLKNISKNILKSKYHTYYKPSSMEFQGQFGKLIYDLYKVVSPAQMYFKSIQNPNAYKHQIINYSLSDHQVDLLAQLDEQKILEVSKKVPIKTLEHDVEAKLQEFTNEFDGSRVNKIENIYKTYTLFRDFCTFDYYVMLKKYDSSFKEYTFTSLPRLEKISAEYLIDDLKDFVAVAYSITDSNVIWDDLFEMFKEVSSKELISVGTWKKVVAKIRNIQTSQILDLCIQHVCQDPNYVSELKYRFDSLVEPYVDKIQSETQALVTKIGTEQKESKANDICMQIFGTTVPQSIKYYTTDYNNILAKKNLNLYDYAEPLNFLKTFLVEYLKKNIREFYDVVVVRGQWDSSLSAPMSNAYQELLKISDEITSFDESMSEEGTYGIKIKTLLPKTAHDSGAENIINRVVSDANDTAKGFILTSSQNLIAIGKTLKQLIEDHAQPKAVIVQNWKELEKFVEEPMKDYMVGIYKKIYLFVQLMQQYLAE